MIERIFESIIGQISEGIVLTDADNKIIFVNHGFTQITGYTKEEVLGQNPSILNSGQHSKDFYHKMWESLRNNKQWNGEIWNKKKDGTIYPESLKIKTYLDSNGNIEYYLAILNDITYLKQFEQKIRSELQLARQIQMNLMPKTYPKIHGIDFYAIYQPMDEVGGDFFDFIEFKNQDSLGVFLSDISGHGIPAALITSIVKTILETSDFNKTSPGLFLNYLNQNLFNLSNGNFLTCFYGVLELKTKLFKYSKAGHPPAFLIRNGEILELNSKGKLLGVFSEIDVEEKQVVLNQGDKVIIYTDGLLEALSPKGIEYETKLLDDLKAFSSLSVQRLIENIYYQLLKHTETNQFEDDLCVIGFEIKV